MRKFLGAGLGLVLVLVSGGCATKPGSFPIHEVAPGIFTGKKPWRKTQFETLRAQGVRTILNLEVMPWDIWPEQWQARHYGLKHLSVPIIAAPWQPGEKSVKKALLILNDPALRPLYVHCYLGKDRSTFLIALYRIYFEGWTAEAAWQEMLQWGFHERFDLRGLKTYFWDHKDPPAWVKSSPKHKPP